MAFTALASKSGIGDEPGLLLVIAHLPYEPTDSCGIGKKVPLGMFKIEHSCFQEGTIGGKNANRRNLRRAERKEAQGRTGQHEREGKSHVGAHQKRESTRAMSGREARKTTVRGRKAATGRSRKADGHTRLELYATAKWKQGDGRSKMSKRQLEKCARDALKISASRLQHRSGQSRDPPSSSVSA
jgi:hypothetical protein